MKYKISILIALLSVLLPVWARAQESAADDRPVARKILFLGDSMTGWLSERLNAYGKENGFEVATVVWDGSTIKKWGGMNELFEANPESQLRSRLEAIVGAAGDIPVIWIGPPSWPGHNKGETLNKWLADNLGEGHFYRSFDLTLPRQSKTNPHPTREGMIKWMDSAVEWIQKDGAVRLPGIKKPAGEQMSRGKTFIYKRMKESL